MKYSPLGYVSQERCIFMYPHDFMHSADLRAIGAAESARAEPSYRGRIKAAASWREFFRPRLVAAAVLVAFVLFIYVLMSFLHQLQPAFTITEAVVGLVLLGLVVSRT